MASCSDCRYGKTRQECDEHLLRRIEYGSVRTFDYDDVICLLNPSPYFKHRDDWCGQYKGREAAQ